MAVRMELSRIFIREMTDMQIIELSEVEGERTFPIVIGLPEAFAIERRLKGIEIPRPQTHDLLATIIEQMGGRLKEIVINDLIDGTFFAKLIIEQDGQEIEVDSRPYVAEHVLSQTESDGSSGFGLEPDDDEEEDWE